MKRMLWTDFFREIRKNKGRFISIFFIVALGAAFFSGIRAAEPDMKYTADTYYKESNLMDLRVLGTLGLTEEDIRDIGAVEGVRRAEGVYTAEALCDAGGAELVLQLISQTTEVNQARVDQGRLPSAADECLVDKAFLEETGYEIGDTISLKSGTETELSETLETTELKIVGSGSLPYYMQLSRGTGTIGDGSIDCFAVLSPEAFLSEVYTEADVQIEGGEAELCYSDAYENRMEEVAERVEEIADAACRRRYDSLKSDLEQELADGREQVEEGEAALADGKQQIEDGKAQLSEAEQTLSEKEQELNTAKAQLSEGQTQLESVRRQIADGDVQIAEAEQTFSEKEQELNTAKAQLSEGQAQYEAGKQEYDSGMEMLKAAQGRLAELQQALEEYEKQMEETGVTTTPDYEAMKAGAETLRQQIENQSAQMAEAEAQLSAAASQLETARQQIAEGEAGLAAGRTQLSEKAQELTAAKEQLAAGEAELSASEQQIADGEAQLSEGRQELESRKEELAAAEEEYNQSYDGAAQELEDARAQLEEGEKALNELEEPIWYVLDRNTIESYVSFGQDSDRIANIGKVFPVMFFLVAALVSLTAMTRMIEEQRTQIGTLKALGYGNGSIAMKYFCYAMLATVGGGVLGVAVGEKILPWIIMSAYGMMYTGLPYYLTPFNWEQAVLAVLASAACTGIATLGACWKELRAKPSELMRPEAPKSGKRVLLERIRPVWKHMSFSQKSTVRNLVRYKKRFFMTVFGIGGCMALMLVGFGVQDSILTVAKNQYVNIFTYNASVTLNTSAGDEAIREMQADIEAYPGMKESMELYGKSVDLEAGGNTRNATMYVPQDLNRVFDFMKFRDRTTGEEYGFPEKGVALSEKTAKMLGVSVGDVITINLNDHPVEAEVEEIVENYVMHYVFLSPVLYEQLCGEAPEYNQLLLNYADTSEEAEKELGQTLMAMDAVSGVTFIRDMEESIDQMLESLNMVIYVLIISAGLLAFVVLYNLNNINITERKRELATIKVLGFYNKEVAEYVYRENVLLTLIGIVAGIGMGIVLHQFVIQTVEVDLMMFGRKINWPSFVYSALLTVAFSVFVNFIMYFRLRKIDMIESLKSVE